MRIRKKEGILKTPSDGLEDQLMHTLNYLFWEILVSSAHTTFAISIILKTTPTRPGQFSDASYIIDSG